MLNKITYGIKPTHRRHAGFTMVELLVVTALVASLAFFTAPSFMGWYVRDRVDARTRTLVASLMYAKSEAIRRGVRVTLCRVDAMHRCIPPGAVCEGGRNDWSCGWAVVTDSHSRSTPSMLRAQPRVDAVAISGHTTEISFTPPAGQVIGGFRSLELAPRGVGANWDSEQARHCILIAAGGRVRRVKGACRGRV